MNNEIDVYFTSLETVYIHASVTNSGRLLHWISLEKPTPDVVIQLFEEVNITITESVKTAICICAPTVHSILAKPMDTLETFTGKCVRFI